MSFADLQAAWARWLLDGLIAGGIERVVVSPGSRSTPLVLAIAAAESDGRLVSRAIVDERSAGFFALGEARATGRPTLLVCTSGTAGAHYLPAVAEAAEARLPVVVLTADRPPELRHRGASQTIDQTGMFGRFVRASFEVGTADPDERAVDGLLRTATLAAHASLWPEPGAVHLNAAFRKPLEPAGRPTPDLATLERRVARAVAAGLRRPDAPRMVPPAPVLDAVAARLRGARRGLIVCGPVSPHAAASHGSVGRLARATRFPLLAEATSQQRLGDLDPDSVVALDTSEPLFASETFAARCSPDLVLQVGNAPTGRALGTWIATSGVERIVLARHGVPEAFNQAARIVIGDLDPALDGLSERIEPSPGSADDAWIAGIEAAVRQAREFAASAAAEPGSQGGAVVAAVRSVPTGGQLVVGNSMPVRDVDLYQPAARREIRVLSQRGAAGIDGLIAGAAGAATATGRPTLLLLGDVSFQHDVGSLATLVDIAAPVAVIVVSNGGGRLFELLPVGRGQGIPDVEGDRGSADGTGMFERYFLTPPHVSVEHAAQAFGLPCVRAEGADAVAAAATQALAFPGATVIEAVVAPDGAGTIRRISERLEDWLAAREACFGG